MAIGSIKATGYSNGNDDIFIMSLNANGSSNFIEFMGASISEVPGAVVWNNSGKAYTVMINTNSIAFKNQGGSDWMLFLLDKKGRNQCSQLGLTDMSTVSNPLTF